MVAALSANGLAGASILEVGAGAGTAIASMFANGAVSATAVDLSPHYEETALRLLSERGVDNAVSWHTGDFVEMADGLPRSDVVFLNRVVCCYPFVDAMLDSATGRAVRLIAVSYPRDRLLTRAFTRLANLWLRMFRSTFRVFVHDPGEIGRRIESAGFDGVAGGRTPAWEWRVWAKPAQGPA